MLRRYAGAGRSRVGGHSGILYPLRPGGHPQQPQTGHGAGAWEEDRQPPRHRPRRVVRAGWPLRCPDAGRPLRDEGHVDREHPAHAAGTPELHPALHHPAGAGGRKQLGIQGAGPFGECEPYRRHLLQDRRVRDPHHSPCRHRRGRRKNVPRICQKVLRSAGRCGV